MRYTQKPFFGIECLMFMLLTTGVAFSGSQKPATYEGVPKLECLVWQPVTFDDSPRAWHPDGSIVDNREVIETIRESSLIGSGSNRYLSIWYSMGSDVEIDGLRLLNNQGRDIDIKESRRKDIKHIDDVRWGGIKFTLGSEEAYPSECKIVLEYSDGLWQEIRRIRDFTFRSNLILNNDIALYPLRNKQSRNLDIVIYSNPMCIGHTQYRFKAVNHNDKEYPQCFSHGLQSAHHGYEHRMFFHLPASDLKELVLESRPIKTATFESVVVLPFGEGDQINKQDPAKTLARRFMNPREAEWDRVFAEQKEGRSFTVFVCDQAGEPLAGAKVRVAMAPNLNKGIRIEKQFETSHQGMCSVPLPDVPVEYLTVSAGKEGFSSERMHKQPHARDLPKQITFTLVPTTVIGGYIRDPQGNPIPGAWVNLAYGREGPAGHTQGSERCTTNRQGYWESDRVGKDLTGLSFSVQALGYTEPYLQSRVGEPPPLPAQDLLDRTAVIVLHPLKNYTMTVVNRNGDPLNHARVEGIDHGSDDVTMAQAYGTTGRSGEYLIRYEPQDIGKRTTLVANAEGYSSVARLVDVPPSKESNHFILSKGKRLHGHVVNTKGKGIAKSYVYAKTSIPIDDRHEMDIDLWRGITDPNGYFIWDEAPNEPVQITVYHTDYKIAKLDLEASNIEHKIVLGTAIQVRGTVTDGETSRPIPEFRLMVTSPYRRGHGIDIWHINSTIYRSGQFNFTRNNPFNGQMIAIEARGYKPALSAPLKEAENDIIYNFKLVASSDPNDIAAFPDYVEQRLVSSFLKKYMKNDND